MIWLHGSSKDVEGVSQDSIRAEVTLSFAVRSNRVDAWSEWGDDFDGLDEGQLLPDLGQLAQHALTQTFTQQLGSLLSDSQPLLCGVCGYCAHVKIVSNQAWGCAEGRMPNPKDR